MKASELENWTLDIVSRVKDGSPVEDSRVELKRKWPPDHARAARRLAGHCNASRGDLALWIIGLDETEGVVGAEMSERSDWLSQVRSRFEDGFAPTLVRDLNVPTDGKTLVALLFDTERAPYVVNNPDGKVPEREVPWREGTAVRTAKREDLLRLLVPMSRLPEIEVMDAWCDTDKLVQSDGRSFWHVSVGASLYIHHIDEKRLCVPFHRCCGELSHSETVESVPLTRIRMIPPWSKSAVPGESVSLFQRPENESLTMGATTTELLIDGPGEVDMNADCNLPTVEGTNCSWPKLRFSVALRPSGADRAIVVAGVLHLEERRTQGGGWRWELKPANA